MKKFFVSFLIIAILICSLSFNSKVVATDLDELNHDDLAQPYNDERL